MHLHHYENAGLSSGLASCTGWNRNLRFPNISINFPDWLQRVQEKHLLEDLAKGVAEGAIKMIFSKSSIDAKVCLISLYTNNK